MRALASLLLLTATAVAGPKPDFDIRFHDKALFVRATDGHEAQLEPVDGLDTWKLDAKTQEVTINYESYACTLSRSATYSVPFLKAKLENAPAFALHRKKQWKTALAGFQRAMAADPTWPIPAYNAASAQQLLGDQDGAIASLAPWLKSAPVRTYIQIHRDPELAPLATRSEVTAIEAKTPGDVEVTQHGITAGAAFSATYSLLAIVRQENGWGASMFTRDVEIYDPTGALVATLPLVEMAETNPDCYTGDLSACELADKAATKKVRDRAANVQQILRALGFSHATTEQASGGAFDGAKHKLSFPKHELGFVELNGSIRILRGNTELAHDGMAGGRFDDALLVEESKQMVVWSHNQGAEGCMSTDPSAVQLIPVKL